ncbi:hypothetical protein [Hydrogenophaga sp. NH-16]|uniref:hypothetical protein n=1 Tax=Hydrogenophaga sp. NH-16 TaxID=2184519 RepID=UPI000FD93B3A|nr:hypothetical protein [Hydrogenophaga sp. NH-16]
MDPDAEMQEFQRQQDDEFWDTKRRDAEQTRTSRSPRARAADHPTDGVLPDPTEAVRSNADATFERLTPASAAPLKKGKPVLTGAVVLLLILGSVAAFMMWSSGGLPFARKKEASPAPAALADPTAPAGAGLPPALPATAPAEAVPAAPAAQDPKLQEQLERLEKRLDQLVAGFKAQGYIKEGAGQDGADLQVADFLPHPSILPPPAAPQPVVSPAASRPAPRKPAVRRPVAAVAPRPTHQVLSVDMWDGRPSVVVGEVGGNPAHVRVLSPGDSYQGVTLTSVDVAGQRATFSDGARSVSIAVERQP